MNGVSNNRAPAFFDPDFKAEPLKPTKSAVASENFALRIKWSFNGERAVSLLKAASPELNALIDAGVRGGEITVYDLPRQRWFSNDTALKRTAYVATVDGERPKTFFVREQTESCGVVTYGPVKMTA